MSDAMMHRHIYIYGWMETRRGATKFGGGGDDGYARCDADGVRRCNAYAYICPDADDHI